jgi:hypothetical protein
MFIHLFIYLFSEASEMRIDEAAIPPGRSQAMKQEPENDKKSSCP